MRSPSTATRRTSTSSRSTPRPSRSRPRTRAQLPDTITYTAWIDDANHLRKVTFDVLGSQATMTMSKYGEPVDITAPAAGDTVKAPL